MRFGYRRPSTIEYALHLLGEDEDHPLPVAYGSDLLVWTKTQAQAPPGRVIDLTGIDALRRIEANDRGLSLGAAVSLAEVGRHALVQERFHALARAVNVMGSVQLREGASLGGNICTASPAGDTGPPLLVYDARMMVVGPQGRREVAAEDFYIGPGKTVLQANELLVAVILPWPPSGCCGTYLKGARRAAVDLALVAVAATFFPHASTATGLDLRMALGAVAPTPIRVPNAEAYVRERGLSTALDMKMKEEIAAAARSAAKPIDDIRASASYRLELVGTLAARAVENLAAAYKSEEKKQ